MKKLVNNEQVVSIIALHKLNNMNELNNVYEMDRVYSNFWNELCCFDVGLKAMKR